MNDVKNVHWGILASVAAGIFFVMFIVFFFVMKITNIMILTIITLKAEFFTMFHTYIMVFLALIFIIPAAFHIYLEFFKEDVPKVKKRLIYIVYYVSTVGLAFLVSFTLFGLGFAPQDYITGKFCIIIGAGFLIGALGTVVIVVYVLLSSSGKLGDFLTLLITAILGMIVASVAIILSLNIILG
ncbi:hypothetical protein ES705_05594 [subsurface metagenome]